MEIIIEQITRNKKVLSYHKVSGDKVKIGRAYDNDVILQEEHISPYHAELDLYAEDDTILLSDLDSTNGIKDGSNKSINGNVRVSSGDTFEIGKTFIRILKSDHNVVDAKKMSVLEDIASYFNQWYFGLLALLAFTSVMVFNKFSESTEELIWSKLLANNAMVSIVLLLIPAVLAISARFFKKEVRFFTGVVFCFSILVINLLFEMFASGLIFNWPESNFVSGIKEVVEFVILTLLIWGGFYLASNMSMKKITTISLVLIIGSWSLIKLSNQSDKVVTIPVAAVTILPSNLIVAAASSPTEYVKQQSDLFSNAEKEALRRKKEAND